MVRGYIITPKRGKRRRARSRYRINGKMSLALAMAALRLQIFAYHDAISGL